MHETKSTYMKSFTVYQGLTSKGESKFMPLMIFIHISKCIINLTYRKVSSNIHGK